MNSNLVRTLLTIGAIVLAILPVFLGCVGLADGSFDCSQSILPPQYAGLGAIGLLLLGMVVKALDGTGLFSTTSTTFRTALTVVGIVVMAATILGGCSTDAVTGAVACTAAWLSPKAGAVLAGVILGLNQVMKKFDAAGLTKPVAK